ncbi:melibiose carrier protein [Candidatus Phycosocius bacilliformis]|uniref:Melibiose carrier protein n=2 Tax=Candidatus Phycosocius bacilliformis TaxID=1445552 RepID=A0A2P2E7X9_9PROT|nr:melibiose carrier protein [Candidatus Phycosocius bacilliformis]
MDTAQPQPGSRPNGAAPKVALTRILAFSAPSLPLAALGLPLVVQLPHHYASFVGLEIGVVGLLFMAARILDIGVDIGIGLAMDQTRTRIGRFSPWLIAAIPVIMVGTWFLFMAEPGADAAYLGFWLFVTYVGFSMGSLSQMSLGATLSDDYHERSRVFVFWQACNVVGMLLALMIPVIVHQQGGTAAAGVQGMGLFIVLLMPITALIAARFAKEEPPRTSARRTNLQDMFSLLKSDACRRLLICDLLLMFGSGVTGGLFLFYFDAVKGYGNLAPALLLIYFIAGLIGAPLWTFIARRKGKHIALIAACLYAAISQPLIMALPEGNFVVAAAGMAIAGIVYTSAAYLLRAMMADIGDEDLLRTGQDRTGLLYALVTLTGKAGYALAVGVTYVGLGLVGFESNLGAENSASALLGLTLLFIGLPSIINLIGAAILRAYPIDAQRTAQLQAEIAAKRAAGLV